MQALEGADDQVGPVARDVEVGVHREAARLADLELEVQRERGGQGIEARPEVGRRGRNAHHARGAPARMSSEHRALDRGQVGVARHDRAGLLERGLRILETVSRQHAHDPPHALAGAVDEQSSHAGR